MSAIGLPSIIIPPLCIVFFPSVVVKCLINVGSTGSSYFFVLFCLFMNFFELFSLSPWLLPTTSSLLRLFSSLSLDKRVLSHSLLAVYYYLLSVHL